MLNKVIVHNFKRFENVEIELADPVVFIVPNNSGKSSLLQALALWDIGLKRWNEKHKNAKTPEKRPGVTINRRDLVFIPIGNASYLWHSQRIRRDQKVEKKQIIQNIRIDIIVEGISNDRIWKCGFEFDYANPEFIYCRPIRLSEDKDSDRLPVPEEARNIQIAFLPPMSGLAMYESRLDSGAINVRVGEGRTAEVLRNICYRIYEENKEKWDRLKLNIEALFGSKLKDPKYISERGEIEMGYEENGIEFEMFCAGRGMQQKLLLLSYMYANPGAVLLLDEPDAHLEILRQRHIYQYLTDIARENKNQLIIASHSEVLLNEAAERDTVIAFLGKPHRINDRGSQLLKSLREIGFEDYYLAEQMDWILYLEGSTDLAILRALAEKLDYEDALKILERPFVHYIGGNQPSKVRDHFYGLREAVPDLKGIAIFDNLQLQSSTDSGLVESIWRKREIENYLCYPETLEAYAQGSYESDLFSTTRSNAMQEAILEVGNALKTLGKGSPWDNNTKISDDFLTPLFENYYKKLGLPNIMAKKNFHELARFVPNEKIDPEVREKLDAIVRVAKSAKPAEID
jgi:hypothetical protein